MEENVSGCFFSEHSVHIIPVFSAEPNHDLKFRQGGHKKIAV